MTTKERQKAYRARQRDLGRTSLTVLVTEKEAFYIKRLIEQMRRSQSVPAMMRRTNGTMEAFDA